MLDKIITIKNIGRFLNYNSSGDVQLKRFNLIFAENGRGKTTLCAILRSLQSADPAHVIGRTTLGADEDPEIMMLLGGGAVKFSNGGWNTLYPNIAIFDSSFVSENIYSGESVSLDHKRNLYMVVVGRRGVELAYKIEDLDKESRTKSAEIKDKKEGIQSLMPRGIKVDEFLKLKEDKEIEKKIQEKERELQAVKEVEQIKTRVALSELTLPEFPLGFEKLLGKTIENIAEDAGRLVIAQIKTHGTHERSEPWLFEGLDYIKENDCPFCSQNLDGVSELIAAYRAYFSKEYNSLKTEIDTYREGVENVFSDREIANIDKILDQNMATIEFWSRYCNLITPAIASGDEIIEDVLRKLRQTSISLLDRKAASPLTCVTIDTEYLKAKDILEKVHREIDLYNQAVRTANDMIAEKKDATVGADVQLVESELARLQATNIRYGRDGQNAYSSYETAIEEKNSIDGQKKKIKIELDDYATRVMGQYEQTINQLLDDFNAGFRITETKHSYPGGVACCIYQILINDIPVELGDGRTDLGKPSFRNTLSSGDKSTLGLAFFLAQLYHDPDIAEKIVVFDDPFNSQDSFRRNCTVQKIKKCGSVCNQVIVLSHDERFLKLIWDQLDHVSDDRKCLQFARIGLQNTTITELDIEEITQSQYYNDRQALLSFCFEAEGDSIEVVRKIRPVLETHIRRLYPDQFTPEDNFGKIIARIREEELTHPLGKILEALEGLNAYTTPFAHGQPEIDYPIIDNNELQGFVKKTLDITGAT